MLCHIRNKHSWKGKKSAHSNICDHSKISSKSRNDVKWFQVHSESFYAAEKIVLNKSFHHFVEFNKHTGQTEVFHSLLNKSYPKRLHLHYIGMTILSSTRYPGF